MHSSLSSGRALPLILCLIAGIIGSTSRAEDDPAKAPQPATPGEVKISDAVLPPEHDVEAEILAALDKGVSISADKVPLRELMRRLSQHFDIPISVDEKALVDEGIALDIPVSVNVTRVSLKNALRIMLNSNQLYATVKHEVLLVTTAAEAVNERRISIYNVDDLIPDPNDELAADRLIELIQNATGGEPDGPWQDIDGDGGTIQFFGDQGASLMVVRQTQSVLDEIDQFLKQLRAARKRSALEGQAQDSPAKVEIPSRHDIIIRFFDVSEFFRLPSMASEANKTYEFSPLIGLVSKVVPPENCEATIAGLNLQGRPFLAIRDSRARLDKVQDMLSALNRLRRRTNRRYGMPYLFDAIQHMGGQTTPP